MSDDWYVLKGHKTLGPLTESEVRHVLETGRIDVPAFYGRRLRRLLPASLLCLASVISGSWHWDVPW